MLPLSNLKITETPNQDNANSSSFIFRYLPPTMGLTIGNYLRRTLLHLIEGMALLAIEISDKNGPVKSKFTTLSGVVETTPYLILNCKKIVAKATAKNKEIYCLEMDVNNQEDKEFVVTAGNFQVNETLEIKNPVCYLATLAPFSRLQLKLYWRENYSYQTASEQEKFFHEHQAEHGENVIILDTDYSPLKGDGVNYQVNSVVTGLEKEEEELKLTITTTGAVSPREALNEALTTINEVNNKIKLELETK